MGLGYTLGTLPIGHMGGSLDPRPAAISALAATEFPKRDCEDLHPFPVSPFLILSLVSVPHPSLPVPWFL
jgi:hypothetical protein